MKTIAFLLATLLGPTALLAQPVPPVTAAGPQWSKATVTRIADGDTVWAKRGKGPEFKLRIHWEDSPETKQPFGKEAIAFATKALLNKEVTYLGRSKSYDRTVADVWEPSGKSYALDLAEHGLGWVDTAFHPTRTASDSDKKAYAELVAAQAKAKAAGKGLWADANPIEPKKWRATERAKNNRPALRRLIGR